MKLGKCCPALFVKDINRSKEFYVNLLGLLVEKDYGTNIILEEGVALWEVRPDHPIAERFGLNGDLAQSPCRFELYFEAEDIKGLFGVLKDAGTPFLHEVHEESWGQLTVRFFDPDGHLIEVGEPLALLVRRLKSGGLTDEEIVGKTGMAMSEVQQLLAL